MVWFVLGVNVFKQICPQSPSNEGSPIAIDSHCTVKRWYLYTVQLIIEIFLEISSLTFQSSKQENNPSCDCCQNVNSYHLTLAYCRSALFSGNNKINEFFIFIVRCWAQLYYCNCWWEKYHA